ncbi:MAG: hypothetical protein JF589_13460 [Gemmatimonadetes bacterium]|nr:hypothetical protein [Gemmatimonadota bacterium]
MDRKSDGIVESTDRDPKESDAEAFARLFRDAYRKCFASPFTTPLTETESHRLSVEIAESTGLEIGWKSLKNYSSFLVGRSGRVENPSVATLDTLARYVAGAPPTDEARRRAGERHYPYWFRYRDALRSETLGEARDTAAEASDQPPPPVARGSDDRPPVPPRSARRSIVANGAVALAALLALLFVAIRHHHGRAEPFMDDFADVSTAALAARGWSVHATDSVYWSRRGERAGHLTLFTLEGDNWPQPGREPVIRNLLVRPLPSDCFDVDVRITSFFPRQNWQQAGLLLLEDTTLTGRSARMSIGYNDFSGGFPQTREIIVQAITSLGHGTGRPEEFVHQRLFVVDSTIEPLVRQNLESSALRIEKRGAHLRLLYSAGPLKNGAFREVGRTDFDFRPTIVALFAIKGFVSQSEVVPVHIDAFSQAEVACTP